MSEEKMIQILGKVGLERRNVPDARINTRDGADVYSCGCVDRK